MSKSCKPRSALYCAMAATGLIGTIGLATESMAGITYYTVDNSSATLSTIGLNQANLGNNVLSNPSALTTGLYNFQYAAVIVTVGEDGAFNFGQTYAPSDTVMILYDGILDPSTPGTGALVGNDDVSADTHRGILGDPTAPVTCGNSTGWCPLISYNVIAGHTYTLLVSGYSVTASNNVNFPFQFYSDANVIFGSYTGRSPIDLMKTYYLASELGITVDPSFVGGTLHMNQTGGLYAQDFTLGHFASSTIDQAGNQSIFTGSFSDTTAGTPGHINIADSVGGGTTVFEGTNTYTGSTILKPGGILSVSRDANLGDTAATLVLDGGTLRTTSSFDSGRDVTLASTGSIQTPDNVMFALSGVVSGTGSLIKEGAGTLNLAGTNTYTGETIVNAGTMNVYSNAGGNVSINGGAFGVHGAGSVGGNVGVNNGGTLMMGNGGTIDGNLTVASGATLRAVGGSGALTVQGATSIDPGVNAALGDGAWTMGDTFALLTVQNADANLLDIFEGQTVSYALYSGLLMRGTGMNANTLYLDVTSRRDAADYAETPNQHSVLTATDQLPTGNPIRDGLLGLATGADVRTAADQLSGEIHASARAAIVDYDRAFVQKLRQRLSGYGGTASGGLASDEGIQGRNLWASVDAYNHSTDKTFNTARTTFKGMGGAIGADTGMGDWIMGAAFRYGDNEAEAGRRHSKADVDSRSFGLYGAWQPSNLSVRFGATYGRHQIDSQRYVPALDNQRLKADYDVDSYQVFAEAGWMYRFTQASLEPYVGVSWNSARNESFTEKGGFAALDAKAKTYDSLLSRVGVKGSYQSDNALWLEWDVNWQHLYGDRNPQSQFAFAGGDRFSIDGAPLSRNAIGANVGAAIPLSQATTLRIGYDGVYGSDSQSHGGYLTISYKF